MAPTYTYKWTIRRNNADVLKEGTLDLTSGKDKIEITGDAPEMIYVAITPDAAAPTGGNTGRNNGLYAVGAAVAPTELGLSTPRPADFDSFWATKLAAQSKIPIHPILTAVETDTPGVEMHTYVLDALWSQSQGYIAKPAKPGKFPRAAPAPVRRCLRAEREVRCRPRRRRLARDGRRLAR